MCGIVGKIKFNQIIEASELKKMTDVIAHRGPDGEGHWVSKDGKVGLGHRRLSIIDLSNEANQPMHYLDRYVIVFNGEIYNYIELKETLIKQGYKFKTQSDTEVLMALYDRDKEDCLQRLDGMFAFVIFDTLENTLFCARDRFGEKPFFYSYKQNEHFYFGSEMKCLWAGGIEKEVNNTMLFNYLNYGYIENPQNLSETFYENCTRLPHSHYIRINIHTNELCTKKYYEIDTNAIDNNITESQAIEKFRELFYTSVSRRLRSDVTVGSSLSGGLDSSLVVCTIDEIKKNETQLQNTFSAVFPGFKKDERKYMDYVIKKTKVNPHFVTPSNEGLIKEFDKLSWHQEEPFVSASIYAQFCVMKLAKEHNTTVLLDGQGADEILAGYHHYFFPFFNGLDRNERKFQKSKFKELHSANSINGVMKKGLGDIVRSLSPNSILPLKKLNIKYNQFVRPILDYEFYAAHKNLVYETPGNNFNNLNSALANSTFKYGLQQLLRYADRNSMAHSIEVRLPFLYNELVEFLFSLPPTLKINSGWTKWLMRKSFEHLLPEQINWRKDKIGYEPPQKSWFESQIMIEELYQRRTLLKKAGILSKKVENYSQNSNWLHFNSASLFK